MGSFVCLFGKFSSAICKLVKISSIHVSYHMICWRRLFRLLCFCPTRWIIHRKDWRNEPKNKLNCPTANQYRESKSTANQYREHSCDLWGSLSPPVDKSPQRSFARLTNHPRGRLLDKPPQSSLYTEVFHTTQKKRTAPTCCPPFNHNNHHIPRSL